MPNAQRLTRVVEGGLELGAAIGQHALQGPPSLAIHRRENVAQERRGSRGRERRQQPGHPVGAGGIAGSDLPDLADPLQLADVERVDRYQCSGLLGLDMAAAAARPGQLPPRALGQQPAGAGTVVLEQAQAVASLPQARPPQDALHRTRGQRHLQLAP
jgi:hypothetical protein